jgi:hypothetical protein
VAAWEADAAYNGARGIDARALVFAVAMGLSMSMTAMVARASARKTQRGHARQGGG